MMPYYIKLKPVMGLITPLSYYSKLRINNTLQYYSMNVLTYKQFANFVLTFAKEMKYFSNEYLLS